MTRSYLGRHAISEREPFDLRDWQRKLIQDKRPVIVLDPGKIDNEWGLRWAREEMRRQAGGR